MMTLRDASWYSCIGLAAGVLGIWVGDARQAPPPKPAADIQHGGAGDSERPEILADGSPSMAPEDVRDAVERAAATLADGDMAAAFETILAADEDLRDQAVLELIGQLDAEQLKALFKEVNESGGRDDNVMLQFAVIDLSLIHI